MRLDQIKRSTLRNIMVGVEWSGPKPRLLERSTVVYHRPDGAKVIRLHRTDILTFFYQPGHDAFHPGWAANDINCYSRIEIRTGGWLSMTTRDRINEFLPGFQVHGKIIQGDRNGGPWYIMPQPSSNKYSHNLTGDHVDWRLDTIELTEGSAIIDGKLPDLPKALAPAAIKAGISRFARYCAEINFTPPSEAGVHWAFERRAFLTALIRGGHRWQRDGGYTPSQLNYVLRRCFANQSPHRLVAHKLGSEAMAAHLRKSVRDYLTNLLQGDTP